MDPAAEAETVQFAESMLEGNDPSHDIGHARAVYRNSISIADDLDLSPRDRLVVFVAALLHDVADHKYPDAEVKRARLAAFVDSFSFFADKQADAEEVLAIVDNVSFSKERGGKRRHHSLLLDVVSDADRLEALGAEGIRRFRADMEEAARHREVLQHCHEKLAVLLPGGYIKTRKGRELAEPLHAEILAFMEEGDGAAGDR